MKKLKPKTTRSQKLPSLSRNKKVQMARNMQSKRNQSQKAQSQSKFTGKQGSTWEDMPGQITPQEIKEEKKRQRQKKVNSKLGKVRNFPPNEYELGPSFITSVLRDEHQSQEFLAYTADYLKLDQLSIHRSIIRMLSSNDHKNQDIMKLVNPSIFDYFSVKMELSDWETLYLRLAYNYISKCFICIKEGYDFIMKDVSKYLDNIQSKPDLLQLDLYIDISINLELNLKRLQKMVSFTKKKKQVRRLKKKDVKMKWDLLNLKKLKKINHFVDSQLANSMFNEEEDDDLDDTVKRYLDQLDEMNKRGVHVKMRKAHKKCYDLLDFFLRWRIWIKEYRLFKIAEAEFNDDPTNGIKLHEQLLRLYNLKDQLVFFDQYSYLKQASRRKVDIVKELEAKLDPLRLQIIEFIDDRNKKVVKILKKICIRTPRKIVWHPYEKIEEIFQKIQDLQKCFHEQNYEELITRYQDMEQEFGEMKEKLQKVHDDFVDKIASVIEEMHEKYDRCLVINDKEFAVIFKRLTQNYEEYELLFNKIKKSVQDKNDPIKNKNFDLANPGRDKQCLWYINSKIQYMIIEDISPILEQWRNLKIFEEVKNTNLYSYNFDFQKFASDEEYGESVEIVHMFISSMNFWRDNGEEYVNKLNLFVQIKNFNIVDKYDKTNRLDRWIKVLFQVTKSIDTYFELNFKDIIVPLGELDFQKDDSNKEIINLVNNVQKKILRDYVSKNVNFRNYEDLMNKFDKLIRIHKNEKPLEIGEIRNDFQKLNNEFDEKASWHKMCKSILTTYITQIKTCLYTIEFLDQMYGSFQKNSLAKNLRKLESEFLEFQNQWFWNKKSEEIDMLSFLKKKYLQMKESSTEIHKTIQSYDVNMLNIQLKETHGKALKTSKALEQFAENCLLICNKEFKHNKTKLSFVQENEIEKNYFQAFVTFIKTFRRNIMVFQYEQERIPGYVFRYNPTESLLGFTKRLAETWHISFRRIEHYFPLDKMTTLNEHALNIKLKDRMGYQGGIFNIKSNVVNGTFKYTIQLQSPWNIEDQANMVLSQKVMGEIQQQKFGLVHKEKKVLNIADSLLPERFQIQCTFDNKTITTYRIGINKYIEDVRQIYIKPFIEKEYQIKILVKAESLHKHEATTLTPSFYRVITRNLNQEEKNKEIEKIMKEKQKEKNEKFDSMLSGDVQGDPSKRVEEEKELNSPLLSNPDESDDEDKDSKDEENEEDDEEEEEEKVNDVEEHKESSEDYESESDNDENYDDLIPQEKIDSQVTLLGSEKSNEVVFIKTKGNLSHTAYDVINITRQTVIGQYYLCIRGLPDTEYYTIPLKVFIYFQDRNDGKLVSTKKVTKCEILTDIQNKVKIFEDENLWKICVFTPHKAIQYEELNWQGRQSTDI